MAVLKVKLEVLVPVPDLELMKEMCRVMVRIQLRHDKGKSIPAEYQRRFEALKVRFVKALHLPKNQTLDNFSLDSQAFLDEEEHKKLESEVE